MKKNITLKDIAQKVGVSIATVDRAIHNRGEINTETKQKIIKTANELGYKPNKIARTLVMKKEIKIGVILPLHPKFFWSEIERGIKYVDENIRDFGVKVSYYRIFDNIDTQRYTIEKLISEGINALIIKPFYHETIIEKLNECIKKGIQVVMINDDIKEINSLFYVGSNDEEAGRTAGQMMSMLLKGKGKIAAVRDSENLSYSLKLRYSAFCKQIGEMSDKLEIIDNMKYLIEITGGYDAYLATKYYIENIPDIAGIYNDSGSIYQVGLAVKNENTEKKIIVIGHEVSPEVNELVVEGYVDAVISQDPFFQGYYSMKNLGDFLIEGKEPEFKQYLSHTDIILKSNIRTRNSMQ
ncbi:MAG TPA: LacI family DNA-binding transcriptional regulator [Clostridiales bacterium]|nr:LacI family DNA-binding transcriptional regulator [Clostridiales bacterium]